MLKLAQEMQLLDRLERLRSPLGPGLAGIMSQVVMPPPTQIIKGRCRFEEDVLTKLKGVPLELDETGAPYANGSPLSGKTYRLITQPPVTMSTVFAVSYSRVFASLEVHVKLLAVKPEYQGNFFALKSFLETVCGVLFGLEHFFIARLWGRTIVNQHLVKPASEWNPDKLVRLYRALGAETRVDTPTEVSLFNPRCREQLIGVAERHGVRFIPSSGPKILRLPH